MLGSKMVDVFSHLEPPGEGLLRAQRLGDGSPYRVARSHDGSPSLLVEVTPDDKTRYGERLEHFAYAPHETVRVASRQGVIEGTHSILSCRGADPDLHRYFFRIMSSLVEELGCRPTSADVDIAVRRVLELFRAMGQPGRGSVQGLWAELLILAVASNVDLAVAAWHTSPGELHDFVSGTQRIEVKSTVSSARCHEVSLDQLHVDRGGIVVLASFMLRASSDGATIDDLVDRVLGRLPSGSDARARVLRVVTETLGEGWEESTYLRYAHAEALASLRLYDARTVPTVDPALPPEVSRVHFRVDLESVDSLALDDARKQGAELAAILPINLDDPGW